MGCRLVNVKLLIASLFILTLVLGLTGLYIYYSGLEPLRLVSECNSVDFVLDKVTYLEYNITDVEGRVYLVKLTNNPDTRSGSIEFYINGELNATVEYRYDTRLTYIRIDYTNGTNVTASGLDTAKYEEAFYTSIALEYDQETGKTSSRPFPGVGPIYGMCYIGKATQVNWSIYASIVKPRETTFGIMDVGMTFGKLSFQGEDVHVVLVRLERRGAIVNKWTLPVYEAAITSVNGVPVALNMVVDIRTAEGADTYVFHVLKIETTG